MEAVEEEAPKEGVEEVSLFEDEKPEGQAVDKAPESVPKNTTKEAESYVIPDKFAGKSLEDVIESYVNLEKEVGRKANEVGELRKLTDQILQNQLSQPEKREETVNEDVGFDDFVEDPQKAVDRALRNNPRIRQLEQELEHSAQDKARQKLHERHPDADDIVGSAEFIHWAQQAPGRLRILQEAHVNRDADIASDLLDIYKTTRKVATEEAVTERDAVAKSDLKRAAVEKGSAGGSTKKVYRRSELIQLKIANPARYEAMSDEIRAAYAEGRVK